MRLRSLLACSALFLLVLPGCEEPRNPPIPEHWAPAPSLSHQARPLPPGSFEGAKTQGGSLLDSYADRQSRDPAEGKTWSLPTNGKTIVVEALIAGVLDDPRRMLELVSDNASWGTPDRRQLHARPISTKADPYGIDFLTAFRNAAARFNTKASFACKPLQPNWSQLADAGAEPMWCSYNSTDGYDLIVFRLVKERAQLKLDYIGFFPERPTGPTYVPNTGFAPPATPYVKTPKTGEGSQQPQMKGRNPMVRQPQARQPQVRPRPSNPAAARPATVPAGSRPAAARPGAEAPIPVEADKRPDRPIAVEAD